MIAHLYVIIYLYGSPIMTMRWANDEMASCMQAKEVQDKNTDKAFNDPEKLKKMREQFPGVERRDIVTTCEMHTVESKPKVKDSTFIEKGE